jgi:hypothetical protein
MKILSFIITGYSPSGYNSRICFLLLIILTTNIYFLISDA